MTTEDILKYADEGQIKHNHIESFTEGAAIDWLFDLVKELARSVKKLEEKTEAHAYTHTETIAWGNKK